MTNKFEMLKEATRLAESLMGETSEKKIKAAIIQKFDSFGLDDKDYPLFDSFVLQWKQQFEAFKAQPLATAIIEQQKKEAAEREKTVAASKPDTQPAN